MKLPQVSVAILLISYMISSPSLAAPNQNRDTPTLGVQGPVDSISIKRGTIVVMDFARQLAPGYKVADSKGKEVSAFNVRPGTPVRLELDTRGRVKRIIIQK